jgi:putative membrane protein
MRDAEGQVQTLASLDQDTRLAFERTYLAHERTQMAWVRTSLTLISFGFAIAKFVRHVPMEQPGRPLSGGIGVGSLMIVIGLVALALASIQHGRSLKTLRAHCPGLRPSLAWVISTLLSGLTTLLSGLGALALVVIFLDL